MFRIQDNVPEVYINDSRDFQLISRIYDVLFTGVKYNIDSLRHTANTAEINAQLLPLLAYKLGFFTHSDVDSERLRHILQIFPSIIHKKGTLSAIKETLNLWFRLNNLPNREIRVYKDLSKHCIIVDLESDSFDTSLLDELFSFIIPAGYYVEYRFILHTAVSKDEADFTTTSKVKVTSKVTETNSMLPTRGEFNSTLAENKAHVGFTRTYHLPLKNINVEEETDQ